MYELIAQRINRKCCAGWMGHPKVCSRDVKGCGMVVTSI